MTNRILAVDYGLKRLGLALSDERRILASPLPFLAASKPLQKTAEQLITLMQKVDATELLVSYPLHLNGTSSFLTDEVHHFVSILKSLTTCPITLWDERLTSAEAERTLKMGGVSRKKRTPIVDSLAAVILLQSYLDSQKHI